MPSEGPDPLSPADGIGGGIGSNRTGAQVVVLGNTAFDSEPLQQACRQKSDSWIFPINSERVLSGKKPRPKVYSLVKDLKPNQFASIRLPPGKGRFVAQRRVAACRIGPKAKTRTFYVHEERHNVQSVGDVQLVFSTMIKPKKGKPVKIQKILMTNDLKLSAGQIVELYDLRWQIAPPIIVTIAIGTGSAIVPPSFSSYASRPTARM